MTPPDLTNLGRDPDVFEAFYREHLDFVERLIARRVGEPETVADLTADVFLAAIEKSGSYRADRGVPRAWLAGIARNVVATEYRRRGRDLRVVRRVGGQRHLDDVSMAHLADRIDAERETRRMYAALAQLPERDRALMELVGVDGMAVNEAADRLGLAPGTARVRLHRIRRRVQDLMNSHTYIHTTTTRPEACS